MRRSQLRDRFRRPGREFIAFADAVAAAAWTTAPTDVGRSWRLCTATAAASKRRARTLVAKVGENISVRRIASSQRRTTCWRATRTARASAWLVAMQGGDEALARDLAMHVAASNPHVHRRAACRPETLDSEREHPHGAGQASGKPAEIVEKMVEGRLAQVPGGDHPAGPAVREGPGYDCRQAAQEPARRSRLRALRSRRGHREEAGELRRRSHEAGQGRSEEADN